MALALVACGLVGTALAAPRPALTGRGPRDAALGSCPASAPISSLPVFAQTGLTSIPDDLTVDPQGDVWVGVEVQGHILDFAPDGSLRQDLPDPNGPEGIILVRAGRFVAQQSRSRIDRLQLDGSLTPFLTLPNRPRKLPVDGLGFDAQRRMLLIPNSPEGTLLTTPLSVASPRVLATRLGRPVAATIGADGSIYVAAESTIGLVRVPRNGGTARRIGVVSNLDEVVSVGNLLYTTGAGDGTVRAVDPSTGADRVLATGGHMLQGLAALPDGRLLVVDSSTHTISFVSTCE